MRVLTLLLTLCCIYMTTCFYPNRLSAPLPTDFTREDLTKLGIIHAILNTTDINIDTLDAMDEEYMRDKITLITTDWPDFPEVLENIVTGNIMVDVFHPDDAVWQFSDEKIYEGHKLLFELRQRLLETDVKDKPSYEVTCDILGQILHLLQSFYSNTNWIEMGKHHILEELGQGGSLFVPVAPASLMTCSKCREYCENNLLSPDFLTSGYLPTYSLDTNKKKDSKIEEKIQSMTTDKLSPSVGKCRHGGIRDKIRDGAREDVRDDITVEGGINKQSSSKDHSPHHHLHKQAAVLAVRHTQYYLKTAVKERTKRAAFSGLDLYHLIADTSGGSVYETDKSNIGAVVDIIKESVSSFPPVTVLKFVMSRSANKTFDIPVDDQVNNMTIKLQSSSSLPTITLFKPTGSAELFTNHNEATKQTLGSKLLVLKLINPTPGKWTLQRGSASQLDVDVNAKTPLDFSYKLMQPGPGGYGEYPLLGRPIAGANTTMQVSVPLIDKIGSVDTVLLLDRKGATLSSLPLHNVGGRRGKSLFKAYISIPTSEFKVAVEGTDKTGNTFRRLDAKIVSTLAIKLEVFPLSGPLYVNGNVTIPYRVTNVGGGTTKIEVGITDDQKFAQSPTKVTYNVASNTGHNGSFVMKAGSTAGTTTTVTISAKASGALNNKVQFHVQRITVERKINRTEDKVPPMCNVTSKVGKCDIGTDKCQCSNKTWSITAEVSDVGFGLQSVFASGAGNGSKFTKDTFSPGHTISKGIIHASLSADCCHQEAKITVVDLAGNVGLCYVSINPGFVAPDPRLCVKPNNLLPPFGVMKTNATRISCNTTQIMGSCDLRGASCNGTNCTKATGSSQCEDNHWSMEAVVGNEGFGNLQAVPVNVGRNATLDKNNHTYMLRTDCCHPDVFINVIDIAGNVGQCQGHIKVIEDKNKSPETNVTQDNSSGSGAGFPVGMVAGGAGGGVAVIGGLSALGLYLKKRLASNDVVPLAA